MKVKGVRPEATLESCVGEISRDELENDAQLDGYSFSLLFQLSASWRQDWESPKSSEPHSQPSLFFPALLGTRNIFITF